MTPSTARFLLRAGVWDDMAPPKSSRFRYMQVWDSAAESFVRYDAADVQATDMGYVVENDLLQASAVRRLRSEDLRDRVEIITGADLTELRLPPYVPTGAWTRSQSGRDASTSADAPFAAAVVLRDGRVITSKLVVGADGANSKCVRAPFILPLSLAALYETYLLLRIHCMYFSAVTKKSLCILSVA